MRRPVHVGPEAALDNRPASGRSDHAFPMLLARFLPLWEEPQLVSGEVALAP
jgi:hypothetical protein